MKKRRAKKKLSRLEIMVRASMIEWAREIMDVTGAFRHAQTYSAFIGNPSLPYPNAS